MPVTGRRRLDGAAEFKRALAELSTEVSTRIGVQANRKAARAFEAELKASVPTGPGAPKVYTAKDGSVRRTDYGHLRHNIKVSKVRGRSVNRIIHVVHTGRAFWAAFVEFGTVRARPHPFFRPAWDRMKGGLVSIQGAELRKGIDRAAKRLGRGGHALPPLIDDDGDE